MASKACCELAPVTAEYDPKGKWETIGDIVGPEDANKAIVDIYDIFGVASQTIQGADRLAALTSGLILMPDLFDGQKLDRGAVPPKSEDKKTQIQAFMAGPANFATNVEKIIRFRQDISLKWPSIEEHVGIFGLCWGGKVAILACGQGNEGKSREFKASGTAHPGGLDPEDAKKTNVPHLLLASPGESADKVAECKKILSSPGYTGNVFTYHTMFHGFMGARANLEDEANRNEYERGYKQVAEFFLKHL